MADETTPNYGFVEPNLSDQMNDFTTYLNNNWDKITNIVAPDSITGPLPQAGAYNIGDRVFRTDDSSIYILVTKDAIWGWFWRPVHAALSPWITVPAAAMIVAPWSGNVNPTNPFAVALDNRGNCHWRGAIGLTAGNITPSVSVNAISPVPVGLRPARSAMFQVGYTTFGAAVNELEGARIFLSNTGTVSIRVMGVFAAGCQINKLYLDGKVRYAIGTGTYFRA